MTLPPALTWMNLIAANQRFDCDQQHPPPGWLAEMVAKLPGGVDCGTTIVSYRKPSAALSDLRNEQSVAAINCPAAAAQTLEAMGFQYVRRLAVMPSLDNARWYIPLDSPALASAGFCLYTPARRSAHFK